MDALAQVVLDQCYHRTNPVTRTPPPPDPVFRGCGNGEKSKCSLKSWNKDGNKTRASLEEAEKILQRENPSSRALKLVREVLASGV